MTEETEEDNEDTIYNDEEFDSYSSDIMGSEDDFEDDDEGEGFGELEDVFFNSNEYVLTGDAKGILQMNIDWLLENPKTTILVEIFCDKEGASKPNLELGEKREESVIQYLRSFGIEDNRIYSINYGNALIFKKGENEEIKASNRRAHFKILNPPEAEF